MKSSTQFHDNGVFHKLANDPGVGARHWANILAWAPAMFQVAKAMRDLGLIKALLAAPEGLSFEELRQDVELTEYSLGVLLDGAKSCSIVYLRNDRYFATVAAGFLENDPLTRVNMDFTQDVCYHGLSRLWPLVDNL